MERNLSIKNFYTSKNVDPPKNEFDIFFNNNFLTPLNEELSKKCEGMLSEKECHLALKDMENGKSPGSDGLSIEFYQVFWDDINLDVVASINYSFEKRQMSICQKRGIISLVPKKDNSTNLLGNLRPISLLNTDYKIATKAIAKRLEAVLPNVINANQTGYWKEALLEKMLYLLVILSTVPQQKISPASLLS